MDKKSCENCKNIACKGSPENVCNDWLRDPRKWLDIPPDDPGYYWVRYGNGILSEDVCHIIEDENDQWVIRLLHSERYHKLSWPKNPQFQGPIRPEG